LIWDPNTVSYTTYLSVPTAASPSGWINAATSLPANPSITVGQGFFLSPSAPFNWTVGL
jgi:hypothetical protein